MDHLQQAQGRPQMATPTATPVLKLEHSPSDSLMSLPATTEFSPLFPATSDAADTPERDLSLEAMTPQSGPASPSPIPDSDLLESFSLPLIDPPLPTTTHAEKKAAKKRKSWGQVLPEPKTNLPPRKRAKTDDEKEQRRVERVLRNRRAAQSSRERKRAETEKLEMRNRELESKVATLQRSNMFLLDTLKQAKAGGQLHIDSPALEALINNPTLGRSVFPATDQPPSSASSSSMGNFGARDATVDPARLSPGLTPIPEDQPLSETSAKESYSGVREPSSTAMDSSADLTQHPAAVLCDLQCQSAEVSSAPKADSLVHWTPTLAWILLLNSVTSTAASFLTNPLWQVVSSMKAGTSLPPSRPILNSIIWTVTRPRRSWTNSSTRTQASTTTTTTWERSKTSSSSNFRPRAAPMTRPNPAATPFSRTLRSKSLKKILTCSPGLARPLADATLEVLRLVSEEHEDRVSRLWVAAGPSPVEERHARRRHLLAGWVRGTPLPSREALLTLLWAIKVQERQLSNTGSSFSQSSPAVVPTKLTSGHTSNCLSKRRCGSEEECVKSSKKQRVG